MGASYSRIFSSAILDTGTTLFMLSSTHFNLVQSWLLKEATTADATTVISSPGRYVCLTQTQLQGFLPCMPSFNVSFLDVNNRVRKSETVGKCA